MQTNNQKHNNKNNKQCKQTTKNTTTRTTNNANKQPKTQQQEQQTMQTNKNTKQQQQQQQQQQQEKRRKKRKRNVSSDLHVESTVVKREEEKRSFLTPGQLFLSLLESLFPFSGVRPTERKKTIRWGAGLSGFKHIKSLKGRLLIRSQTRNLQIFEVTPFVKLQNDP